MITTLLFDLDNTLIATREIDELACKDVCNWLLTQGISDHVSQFVCDKFLSLYRDSPSPTEPRHNLKELHDWRCSIWSNVLSRHSIEHLAVNAFTVWQDKRLLCLKLNGEVKLLLTELLEDYTIGIITNGCSSAQWEKVSASGVHQLVPCVVISGDTGLEKPNAEIFNIIFDKLQVVPEDCLIIGDNLKTDILGGKNAGIGVTVKVEMLRDRHFRKRRSAGVAEHATDHVSNESNATDHVPNESNASNRTTDHVPNESNASDRATDHVPNESNATLIISKATARDTNCSSRLSDTAVHGNNAAMSDIKGIESVRDSNDVLNETNNILKYKNSPLDYVSINDHTSVLSDNKVRSECEDTVVEEDKTFIKLPTNDNFPRKEIKSSSNVPVTADYYIRSVFDLPGVLSLLKNIRQ